MGLFFSSQLSLGDGQIGKRESWFILFLLVNEGLQSHSLHKKKGGKHNAKISFSVYSLNLLGKKNKLDIIGE